jgi:hypothetical protein
MATNPS